MGMPKNRYHTGDEVYWPSNEEVSGKWLVIEVIYSDSFIQNIESYRGESGGVWTACTYIYLIRKGLKSRLVSEDRLEPVRSANIEVTNEV
jgi:hypothetical protein